jgi:hypothetical protein
MSRHPGRTIREGPLHKEPQQTEFPTVTPRRQHQTQQTTRGGEEKANQPSKKKYKDLPGQNEGNKHTSTLDSMFKVVTVVQQIMSELKESVSEEGKIMAITKIVMKLLNNEQ